MSDSPAEDEERREDNLEPDTSDSDDNDSELDSYRSNACGKENESLAR